jgi:hypothetical protein
VIGPTIGCCRRLLPWLFARTSCRAHQRRNSALFTDNERCGEPVPRQHVHSPPNDHGWNSVKRVEQVLHLGPYALWLWRAAPAAGGAAEVVQVRELVVVEAERSRNRLEDLGRRPACAALLEADVVVDADAGKLGELLPAQARHPAPPERGEADVFRSQACTARMQELTEVGALAHGSSMRAASPPRVAPPVPGTPVRGSTILWLAVDRARRITRVTDDPKKGARR